MNRRLPATVLALFALVLAGCAPGAVGTRGTPYDLRRGETAQVAPGGVVYAQLLLPASELGLADADFSGLFVPCGGDASCAVVTSRFDLVDVAAPEGWTWRVDRADAVRRPRFATQVDVRLRLDVPAAARLGGTELRARLVTRDGTARPVALIVQVVR
jgi:hypothetical protein